MRDVFAVVGDELDPNEDTVVQQVGRDLVARLTEVYSLSRVFRPGVTVCIAAHPRRFENGKLERALRSVLAQTRQPEAIVIVNDVERLGASSTRQRCLDGVQTEWMAWLDSDDEWLPVHLERCLQVAQATGAMFVYPWMTPENDPLGHFGIPFNPATPHHTTITFLVRTEIAQRVGFVDATHQGETQKYGNEDWIHLLGLCEIAVRENLPMVHLAERTWRYHFDGLNSSGVPGQGDAK